MRRAKYRKCAKRTNQSLASTFLFEFGLCEGHHELRDARPNFALNSLISQHSDIVPSNLYLSSRDILILFFVG